VRAPGVVKAQSARPEDKLERRPRARLRTPMMGHPLNPFDGDAVAATRCEQCQQPLVSSSVGMQAGRHQTCDSVRMLAEGLQLRLQTETVLIVIAGSYVFTFRFVIILPQAACHHKHLAACLAFVYTVIFSKVDSDSLFNSWKFLRLQSEIRYFQHVNLLKFTNWV